MAILILTTNNRAEASVDNVAYILRETATDCWSTHNIEEIKDKSDALTYATRRAFEEKLKPSRSETPRNHMRMKLTFSDETDPKVALENSKIFLEKHFPNAKIIYSSHKDTDNCHVHCWVDNRQTDEKKVHLSNSKFYKLGENWSKHCDQIYGTNYTEQFRKSRKEHNQSKKDGIEPPKLKQNQILKEAQLKDEQGRITIGKQLIKRSSEIINESSRRINELKQLHEYGNQLELARIGREGSERQRSSNDQARPNPIRSPREIETRSTINR
jgi:hypothetical protein